MKVYPRAIGAFGVHQWGFLLLQLTPYYSRWVENTAKQHLLNNTWFETKILILNSYVHDVHVIRDVFDTALFSP